MGHRRYLYLCIFSIFTTLYGASGQSPRITVVVIIDGCGHHVIQKIKPHFQGGIKTILDNGIVYHNAYFPHASPTTAPGHAALNTGAYAKDHGIIGNKWFDKHTGMNMACDDDSAHHAAVFGHHGFQPYGKSCRLAQVDGVSDEIVRANQPATPKKVVSISLKSRAAIHTAGKRGTAIWFDQKSGMFTSSMAYMKELPTWLREFNKQQMANIPNFSWNKAYPDNQAAYNFKHITNYSHVIASPMVGKTFPFANDKGKSSYSIFYRTPLAIEKLFACAQDYVDHHVQHEPNSDLLLWISISSSDKVGHIYGPQSLEYIDTLYHIDKQLDSFITHIYGRYKPQETLFALTADHGSTPLPELLHEEGTTTAQRIQSETLLNELNNHIKQQFDIYPVVSSIKLPHIYINHSEIEHLSPAKQDAVFQSLKQRLLRHPAIQTAWTQHELTNVACNPCDLEYYYKNQLFPSRSGDILFKVRPYTYISSYPYGTGHLTPYEYNTHVPLALYQPKVLYNKPVYERVSLLQFAPTLSSLFDVPNPTACTVNMLPGIHN